MKKTHGSVHIPLIFIAFESSTIHSRREVFFSYIEIDSAFFSFFERVFFCSYYGFNIIIQNYTKRVTMILQVVTFTEIKFFFMFHIDPNLDSLQCDTINFLVNDVRGLFKLMTY